MQVKVVKESKRLWTEAALVRLRVCVFSSDVTVEIILSSESPIADVANEVLRDIRVVSVEVLPQLVLVEESFPALAAHERLVVFMSEHVSHDFFAVWIRFLADAALVSDILLVILSMPNHVAERETYVRAEDARVLSLRMRLHVLHHLVVRREDLSANATQIRMVVGSFNR